jgi:uncharacterized protein (TIRG00374 family)
VSQRKKRIEEEQRKFLESVRIQKIIVPMVIGLLVVVYFIWRKFDAEEFSKINWTSWTLFWLGMAVFAYVLRHLSYAWRLRILSDKVFSWSKSIELIFIWEFASSVSPTSLGGSAVALVLLAQEKLTAAKTVTVVLYSVVVDTLFFVISMPLLYIWLGPKSLRPDMNSLSELDGFGLTFLLVLFVMMIYGAIFFYGLFINPVQLKRFLIWISRWRILKKFSRNIRETAFDVEVSSKELRKKDWRYHLTILAGTSGAWITRFLAINFILLALLGAANTDFFTQLIWYARGETMYAVTAFSPTPGGSGFAEVIFGDFFNDYISKSNSFMAALIWRLITYYPYILIGVIIIPNWIRKVLNRRKLDHI